MITIYRSRPSDGANALAEAVGGRRIRQQINLRGRAEDLIVCWGEALESVSNPLSGTRVQSQPTILNGGPIRTKLEDALRLAEADVPTIVVSEQRPQSGPRLDEVAIAAARRSASVASQLVTGTINEMTTTQALHLTARVGDQAAAIERLIAAFGATLPAEEWLGRRNNHQGGSDLLRPPASPDYWVRKETLVREFRVHSFDGRSIRAGVKTIRDGMRTPMGDVIPTHNPDHAPHTDLAHPWIRSHEAGWRISYDGESIADRHRLMAHLACQALGLTFGAVDIGQRADGSLMVLEVNRAPGLEGGTIDAYAEAITSWWEAE